MQIRRLPSPFHTHTNMQTHTHSTTTCTSPQGFPAVGIYITSSCGTLVVHWRGNVPVTRKQCIINSNNQISVSPGTTHLTATVVADWSPASRCLSLSAGFYIIHIYVPGLLLLVNFIWRDNKGNDCHETLYRHFVEFGYALTLPLVQPSGQFPAKKRFFSSASAVLWV